MSVWCLWGMFAVGFGLGALAGVTGTVLLWYSRFAKKLREEAAEIDRHIAELQARIATGCRRTSGPIG